jgi:hypothetical protein
MTFKKILKEKEFWFLCSLPLLVFSGAFLFGETFFYRDLYQHFVPTKKLFTEIIKSGQLPLWNPYLHGGQPFLAEINFSVLYPSNVLYLILPFYTAFNINIIGHVMFAAAGAYCLARFTGMSAYGSLFCGVIFAFCGYSLSQVNLLSRLLAYPYIPWLCLFWHRFLLEKQFKWFFICALFATFQIFAGTPEWTLVAFLLMLIWSLGVPYEISNRRKIVNLLFLGIVTLLFSAIQIIPTSEMVAVSSRSQKATFDAFSFWSIHPERLPEFVLPNFLGRTDTLSANDYWGSAIEYLRFPYVLSIYFGFAVLLLAVCGLKSPQKHSRKLCYLLAATALLAILFSLGKYFPLTYFVYKWVPGVDRFRYPVKFLCAAILPISYLAASGFESHWSNPDRKTSRIVLIWLFSFAIAMLIFAWLITSESFLNSFAHIFFKQPASPTLKSGIISSIVQSFTTTILLGIIYSFARLHQSNWQKIVLILVITGDLIIAARNLNPLAPISFYEEVPNAAKLVKKELAGGKFYRAPTPKGIVLKAPSNDILWMYRWNEEVLDDYLGTTYGIPMIFHIDIDGLQQKRLTDLTNSLKTLPWKNKLPLLSAAGVSVIMTNEKLSAPGIELRYVLNNQSNMTFYIYKNSNAVIPAFRISQILYKKDFKDSFANLSDEHFSPNKIAVSDEAMQSTSNCNDPRANVRILRQNLNAMEYETEGTCEGIVVLPMPFYKNWQANVDGNAEHLLRMNWAFSGVKVPPGKHHISLTYSARSIKLGALVSLASLFLAVVVGFKMNQHLLV